MFESLKEAFEWARKTYPNCSFSVREQEDGPTIISVKGREDNQIRTVIYARQSKEKDG